MVGLFVLLVFNSANAQHPHSSTHLVGYHGMVLLYDKQTGFYASHMPLYHKPHNYQVIYHVEMPKADNLMLELKKGLVTMLPERFDLQKLIDGKPFTIGAQFYQGHFERGGVELIKRQVRFSRAVLIKPVTPLTQTTATKIHNANFYVAPISANKAIVVHKIQRPPSFDAIGFISKTNLTVDESKASFPEMVACGLPTRINADAIGKSMTQCHLTQPSYVETIDFK